MLLIFGRVVRFVFMDVWFVMFIGKICVFFMLMFFNCVVDWVESMSL